MLVLIISTPNKSFKTFVGKYKTKEGAKSAIINKLKETGHIVLED